jgi:hypothetical protein
MLRKKVSQLRSNDKTNEKYKDSILQAKKVLQLETYIPDISSFPDDTAVYDTQHRKVLQILEHMNQ